MISSTPQPLHQAPTELNLDPSHDNSVKPFLPGQPHGTHLRALGDNVILQPVDQDLLPSSSLLVIVANNVAVNRGIILAIGPFVPTGPETGFAVGDVIQHVVPAKGASTVRENGRVMAVMPYSNFVAMESPSMAAAVRAQVVNADIGPHPTMTRSL